MLRASGSERSIARLLNWVITARGRAITNGERRLFTGVQLVRNRRNAKLLFEPFRGACEDARVSPVPLHRPISCESRGGGEWMVLDSAAIVLRGAAD